jgi:hypothetical protein
METTMINNTKQNWTIGATVKVGFMTLVVKAAIATPGDYAPDAYILANQAITQLYKFVPHNGLVKIDAHEARDMLDEQAAVDIAAVARVAQKDAARAEITEVFAA